ncbi:hypothetical protein [Terribacillus saccharophilus]|uniref:hypothetical protein n=1 Tax=Terribacillus saccharophilus TaxID=361277 RepID=UPI002989D915|nr:hypothetical protein [Terribacillus saccharophilus]MCM3227504.1 hypothetical protein [Terribacillus saccharophilus]
MQSTEITIEEIGVKYSTMDIKMIKRIIGLNKPESPLYECVIDSRERNAILFYFSKESVVTYHCRISDIRVYPREMFDSMIDMYRKLS